MQQGYSVASPAATSQVSLPRLTGRAYMVIGVFHDADMVLVRIEALDMCRQDINVELALCNGCLGSTITDFTSPSVTFLLPRLKKITN